MKFEEKLVYLCLALLLQSMSGCDHFECHNSIIETIESSDRSYKAFLFSRDCGTTVGFNRQVTILEKNSKFSDENIGNVFRCEGGEVKIAWKDAKTLSVRLTGDFKIYEKNAHLNGVNIEYENIGSQSNSGNQPQ